MKIEEKKKTSPKEKAGEGPVGWVRPLYLHDENSRLVWCSAPSLVATVGKKGDYIMCLICHQKISFNKYSWTTPQQHIRKHKIHNPNDLEKAV